MLFPLAVSFLFVSCASFKSGDIYPSRANIRRMLEDKNKKPFSELEIKWQVIPYSRLKSTIAEPAQSRAPLNASARDLRFLRKKTEKIFSEAGIYSPQKGEGKIKILLVSIGKWTYKDIFTSFLTETPWIMIFPVSLRINYYFKAEFTDKNGEHILQRTATNKTVFHPLMIPLYPLSSPGAKERSIIKLLLWKTAMDIYMEKFAGAEIKFCNIFEELKENLRAFSNNLDSLSVLSDVKRNIRKLIKNIDSYLYLASRQCPYEKNIPAYYKSVQKETLPALKRLDYVMSNLPKYGYPPDTCWTDARKNIGLSSLEEWNRFFSVYSCCAGKGTIHGCIHDNAQ